MLTLFHLSQDKQGDEQAVTAEDEREGRRGRVSWQFIPGRGV